MIKNNQSDRALKYFDAYQGSYHAVTRNTVQELINTRDEK
jgi:hypothetical protein